MRLLGLHELEDLLLLVLIDLAQQVSGVVGRHVLDDVSGAVGIEVLEDGELGVDVELLERVGGRLLIERTDERRLICRRELLDDGGEIGRVDAVDLVLRHAQA